MCKFNLKGETPSKKNSRVTNRSTGRTFPNLRFVEWHTAAKIQLLAQKRKYEHLPIDTDCCITLIFIHGDYTRRDSDNQASSILDLLKDCGIIHDDNWQIVRKIIIKNGYLKNEPQCSIIIDNVGLMRG